MKQIRAAERRGLDRRLAGLDQAVGTVGTRPGRGWIRTIRDALGMSAFDLGLRMGVSQSRVSQLERAECNRSINLGALQRAAEAMRCRLVYVFIPQEPLVSIVHEQARAKAAAELRASAVEAGRQRELSDLSGMEDYDVLDELDAVIEARAYELIDWWTLWRPP